MTQVLRALLPLLSLVVLLLLGGWRGLPSSSAEPPPGCEDVFRATTRGSGSASSGGLSCSLRPPSGTVLVERVVDGDTIVLAGGERVRYVGIDAPEISGEPEHFGQEALEANRRLVAGGRVRLERDVSDRDRFGRLLRYVYVDELLVNAEMVREGMVEVLVFPPDITYTSCLAALEEEAKEAQRGLWGQ